MYLLFDCNNFFASCEQVFRPDWRRRPLVVLSNNDGCVISRSPEAKAMGIAMGEPYFKCKERLASADAVVCSANFSLYSDLSERIMRILEESLPETHQYSIDEAFAKVEAGHWASFCRELRKKIRRWTGVTVSVGIAPTKTLCKLANETAKHTPQMQGVCDLSTPEQWLPVLQASPVEDVWGVGRKLAPRMHSLGIRTAAGLAEAPLTWLRKEFGVHGERLALELRGVSCSDADEHNVRGQVMVSRSLKEGIRDIATLRESLCRFVEKAGRILRSEGLMASQLFVILRTSRFNETDNLYSAHQGIELPCYTDDTRVFTHYATSLLENIYRTGYEYKKVGVLLAGLEEVHLVQPTFEHPNVGPDKLMQVLDKLQQNGLNIGFANRGKSTPWHKEFLSRCYTTCWDDIPETSRD
ncbi:MAG: Y-family DNA polymerase [Akkermansia sp.]|nr:Y-family DNA polymerase [Akkermansia sp.]